LAILYLSDDYFLAVKEIKRFHWFSWFQSPGGRIFFRQKCEFLSRESPFSPRKDTSLGRLEL